jgi:hypothetical protein
MAARTQVVHGEVAAVRLGDTARKAGISDEELGRSYEAIYRRILDPDRFPSLSRTMAAATPPGGRRDAG